MTAAGVDDLEEQVGGLGRLLAFDVIEAKFVDDQQVEAGVVTHPLGQGLIGQRRRQVFQQAGAGDVADGVAQRTRTLADRLDQERFSHAALPDQDEIVPASDEGGGGKFLDLNAVDGRSVELPVEGAQRLEFAEACLADAAGDAAFPALTGLVGDEQVQELLVRPGPRARRSARTASSCSARKGTLSVAKSARIRSRRSTGVVVAGLFGVGRGGIGRGFVRRAMSGRFLGKMLVIGGGTWRDRVVAQVRRAGAGVPARPRVQDALGPGLGGQDAFDGVERIGAEADGPLQGGQQSLRA